MELRVEGDKDGVEYGKAEPEPWELQLFWMETLGRGRDGVVGKVWDVRPAFEDEQVWYAARGSVRGRW